MTSKDITYCNNHRCQIDCIRNKHNWPISLKHISMAAFGPINGDEVTKPDDCNMFLRE